MPIVTHDIVRHTNGANESATSSSLRLSPSATELRLDCTDMSGGLLVIVIQGFPGDSLTPSTTTPRMNVAPGSDRNGHHVAPSSPLIVEADAINQATGCAPAFITPLLLAAWRGQEALALELGAVTIDEGAIEDARRATGLADYAMAVLYNGRGRYPEALAAAERACAHEDHGLFWWAQLELIEACARSGTRAVAARMLGNFDERMGAGGSDWALGVRARSAALLSDGNVAEPLYREAIERFDRAGVGGHLARTQLVYGEWLRRENRRVDARDQLRAAHVALSDMAAEAFAERARRELVATGETARRRIDETRDVLTAQESEVARLAAAGRTNAEIGELLYISARTVEYHLRKVFVKLGVTSRRQLRDPALLAASS
jgi:DNA-binding CsgD family transcriptional regulator